MMTEPTSAPPPSLTALVCMSSALDRRAVQAALARASGLEPLDGPSDGRRIAERCAELNPDIVILDECVVGIDAFVAARSIAVAHRTPVLVLVHVRRDRDTQRELLDRRLRVYSLEAAAFHQPDLTSRTLVRTQLQIVASRAREPRITLGDEGWTQLAHADRGAGAPRPHVAALLDHPLDIIVVAGTGCPAVAGALSVLGDVDAPRVPVLLALHATEAQATPMMRQALAHALPLRPLQRSFRLRYARGVMLALQHRRVTLERDVLRVDPWRPLDIVQTLGSVATAGNHGLALLLGHARDGASSDGLTAAACGGAAVATIGMEGLDPPGATPEITRLSFAEATWVIGNAVPRAV